jgi:hypothetical protein
MENIVITKDLDIGFEDLCRVVHPTSPFTLRDIIVIVNSSTKIRFSRMCEILHCHYIGEFLDEMNKPKEEIENEYNNMEYLEVYWCGDKSKFEGQLDMSSMWSFHGVGKKGVISDEVKEYVPVEEHADYVENYAIEFTPVNKLADYQIRIRPEMYITNWEEIDPLKNFQKIELRPSITLIELLYAIFYELTFCGSPKERDEQLKELKSRCEELNEAKKNGTLDQITKPWEEVKARLEKKIEELKELERLKEKLAVLKKKAKEDRESNNEGG